MYPKRVYFLLPSTTSLWLISFAHECKIHCLGWSVRPSFKRFFGHLRIGLRVTDIVSISPNCPLSIFSATTYPPILIWFRFTILHRFLLLLIFLLLLYRVVLIVFSAFPLLSFCLTLVFLPFCVSQGRCLPLSRAAFTFLAPFCIVLFVLRIFYH